MYMTHSLSHGTRAKSKSEMITCFKGRLSVKLKRLILIWIHTMVGWSLRYWTNSVLNSISKYPFPFLFSSWWHSALNRQFPFPSLSTIFNPLAAAFLSKSVNKVCLLLLTGWWCNCCKLHKACFAKKRRKKAFLISLFQTIARREWMFYELSESMSHESTDRMSGFLIEIKKWSWQLLQNNNWEWHKQWRMTDIICTWKHPTSAALTRLH